MKRFIITTLTVLSLAAACQKPEMQEVDVLEIPAGAVELQDMEFGMYYGEDNQDTLGVFSLVLSDARCYQEKLGQPFMDSEGDMLVLNFRAPFVKEGQEIALPSGNYDVSESGSSKTVYAPESYVIRTSGNTQTRWNISSGTVKVTKGVGGKYSLYTRDLALEKDGVVDTVNYVCLSPLKFDDYSLLLPSLLGTSDDIINVPFPYLNCTYYGNLYGNGTGNFVVSMATKGFIVLNDEGVEEMTDVAGVYLTLNFFSRLYVGNAAPVIEAGRYDVSSLASDELLSRWTLFPGVLMDGTPFGSYVLQQPAQGEGTMEYISGGYVDVQYPETEPATKAALSQYCVMTFDLKTSSRKIKGVWRGHMPVTNLAESSADSYLTTLDHDVECDMSKATEATLTLVETLHRKNVESELDYNIAEAWRLYIAPRDWTAAEKEIPWVDEENPKGADGIEGTDDDWMYDKNNNGIRDRLEAWCGDGDVMSLEFVLPLGSQGTIAPELNKTYTYTMQPSLAIDAEMYEIYVSQMGRPADEIFDAQYAREHKGWAEGLNITSYDRCNARRGFTWSTDGFRGNWYIHNETGRHQVIDEHAPAINGTVKVTRTGADIYDLEWDFIDDYPGTPNKITGSVKGLKVKKYLN